MEKITEKELDVFIQDGTLPNDEKKVLPDWKKDIKNIFLLIFLYILQGVNMNIKNKFFF
jgi:hypothetical protein